MKFTVTGQLVARANGETNRMEKLLLKIHALKNITFFTAVLAKGKSTTSPYRWINKDGGWIWLQSITTRIQDEKTGKNYMLCVNYVLR